MRGQSIFALTDRLIYVVRATKEIDNAPCVGQFTYLSFENDLLRAEVGPKISTPHHVRNVPRFAISNSPQP